MDVDSHVKGPTDCPNYYNPNRTLVFLTAKQKFGPKCAPALRKSHPAEFKALTAILAAFD